MPIFQSLDLEWMLIYQNFFYEKVLFFTQLSYHLLCRLLKKSYMLSTVETAKPILANALKTAFLDSSWNLGLNKIKDASIQSSLS